ncbi:hypothetical protein EJB05_57019, partial [Eragrostis curvula]
ARPRPGPALLHLLQRPPRRAPPRPCHLLHLRHLPPRRAPPSTRPDAPALDPPRPGPDFFSTSGSATPPPACCPGPFPPRPSSPPPARKLESELAAMFYMEMQFILVRQF